MPSAMVLYTFVFLALRSYEHKTSTNAYPGQIAFVGNELWEALIHSAGRSSKHRARIRTEAIAAFMSHSGPLQPGRIEN